MNRLGTSAVLGVSLIVLHAGLLAWLAVRYSPTQDEAAHLPGGLAVWRFGDFGLYRVNPPLARAVAAVPVLFVEHQEDWTGYRPGAPQRQEWRMGAQFIRANGTNSWRLYTLARWACIPFSLLGAVICWKWGTELAGPICGLSALALWCCSPNILGHGALITPDVAAVSCGLLAAYCFQKWRQSPGFDTAFVAGLTLGLALLSKTYWIILLVLWPGIAGWDLWRRQRSVRAPTSPHGPTQCAPSPSPVNPLQHFGQLLVLLVVGLNVLNLGFGFQGTGTRLGDLPFFSKHLAGETLQPIRDIPQNRWKETVLGQIALPFPSDYITGIDVQKADFELGKWSYLLGETRERGWWHYYLVGLAVKVPLGTWLLALWGTALLAQPHSADRTWNRFAPLWVAAVCVFLLASSQTGLSRHVRYVFSMLPVLYLLAGIAVAWGVAGMAGVPDAVRGVNPSRLPDKLKWALRRTWRALPQIVLFYALFSSLRYYPHSLSYFNELAGGPENGEQVLIDSNIDWGQDLALVDEWLDSHPQARPVRIAWLGFYSLRDVGLDVQLVNPNHIDPGWYIIGVNQLYEPHGRYELFRRLTPVDRIGYSMRVYRVYHVTEPVPLPQGEPDSAATATSARSPSPIPTHSAR